MAVTLIPNFVEDTDMIGRYRIYFQNNEITVFNNSVTDWEYEALTDLFGDEFYNAFRVGLLEPVIEQKWLDLRDGKTYNSCTCFEDRNYRGMVNLLVPYIFSKWVLRNQNFVTITGSKSFENENARDLNEKELKQLSWSAWNEFIERYRLAYDFLISEDYETDGICIINKKLPKKGLVTKTNIS